MRFGILCILLFCISCTHIPSLYKINSDGIPIHQCTLPVLYAVSEQIPKNNRDLIYRSFEYWNTVIDKKLFFNLGVTSYEASDPETGGYVVVGLLDDDKRCCVTAYRYNDKMSCLVQVKVYITKKCLNLDKNLFETAIRHEAGHVLGLLEHSQNLGDLMWPRLDSSLQNPLDVSENELNAIKNLYGVNK